MSWYSHKHLPQWIENSKLAQYFLLFRKLYLTKHSKKYYGQEAEDVALKRIFPRGLNGFFVDVGCFHPIKYNNTYFFYKQGWRGINIDIDPIKIKGFNWVRKADTNIAMAVSSKKGEIEYWTNGFYSLVNTLDKNARHKDYDYIKKISPSDTLTNIIENTKYTGREIDLLSIDAEGHDLIVLKSLDIKKYNPKVIVMETNVGKLNNLLQSELYNFLKGYDYDLINWTGLSLIFRKNGVVF